VSQVDQIAHLEEDTSELERVSLVTAWILSHLMKSSPPGIDLERVRSFLRSALDLIRHGEFDTSKGLIRQAEEGLASLRQWLAVADLAITPLQLRSFLEKNSMAPEQQQSMIRYFLHKLPRAENDRDKLDYLLSLFFSEGSENALNQEELAQQVGEFFTGTIPSELPASAEMMLHELESLIARLDDFTDFDALVQARIVERARALKISLGEEFYHPRALLTTIRFNLAFREHFEELFHAQVERVRQSTRHRIEIAWSLIHSIESSYEAVAQKSAQPIPPEEEERKELAPVPPAQPVAQTLPGRDERPPIDRLIRRGEEPQKEKELTGIIARLARFVHELSQQQLRSDAVIFPLRYGQIELALWEREAFDPTSQESAPESVRLIQYALGIVAWMEEEFALYHRASEDRYFWKPHFDHLSYAVLRSVELLRAMLNLVRVDSPEGETVWFGCLMRSALRMGSSLNCIAAVFEEPAPAASH
jgi:hypothetical protein